MTEYSVEEVLESARKAAASNGRAKEASMLFAYADLLERIEADGGAVPVAEVGRDWTLHWVGHGPIAPIITENNIRIGDKLFTHPPAQAAQSCEKCKGRGEVFNDVHVRMMTCPHCHGAGKVAPAEPVAQAAQADLRNSLLRGKAQNEEPRVRHSCNMGVGCEEAGVCYAEAHGQPKQCGRPTAEPVAHGEAYADVLQRLGDDAAKWAKEFRATALRLGYSDMDEGWLIGWFANAIEHSGDVRRWRRESATPAKPAELVVEGCARYIDTGNARWDSAAFQAWREGSNPGSHAWIKRIRELLTAAQQADR